MTTKNARRRSSKRGVLRIIALIALCTWGGLLLFTYYVQPETRTAFVVFILLSLALWSTSSLLIYFISWTILSRRGRLPRLLQAIRESGMISAWLMFNVLLSSLNSWSIFSAAVSFGIIVVIELLVLAHS